MSKRKKRNNPINILLDEQLGFVANFDTLKKVESLAYRKVCSSNQRNLSMPILNNDALFTQISRTFSQYNNAQFKYIMDTSPAFARTVNRLVKSGRHNIRRMKKQSTRLHKAIKKSCKNDRFFEGRTKELVKSEEMFFRAYRESFVIARKRIPATVYESIPNNVFVTLSNNENILLLDCYIPSGDEFIRTDNINSLADSRIVQYSLAKYSFPIIHDRYI